MTDTDYKLTCTNSENGAHEWNCMGPVSVCEHCQCHLYTLETLRHLNAAARHIAGLEKRIEQMVWQLDICYRRIGGLRALVSEFADLHPDGNPKHLIDKAIAVRTEWTDPCLRGEIVQFSSTPLAVARGGNDEVGNL